MFITERSNSARIQPCCVEIAVIPKGLDQFGGLESFAASGEDEQAHSQQIGAQGLV
jgi:hypothetical protein